MAHRGRLAAGALGALLLAGCSIPKAPDLWHGGAAGPPSPAPAAADWAFVAAGSFGDLDADDDDEGGRVEGPTSVYAGYRGEGPGEREFDPFELEQAGFRGFSAPTPAASFEGPRSEPLSRAAGFQPLREVPR